jgi:hypothetical protein
MVEIGAIFTTGGLDQSHFFELSQGDSDTISRQPRHLADTCLAWPAGSFGMGVFDEAQVDWQGGALEHPQAFDEVIGESRVACVN